MILLVSFFLTQQGLGQSRRPLGKRNRARIIASVPKLYSNTEIRKNLPPRAQNRYLVKRGELYLAVQKFEERKRRRSYGKKRRGPRGRKGQKRKRTASLLNSSIDKIYASYSPKSSLESLIFLSQFFTTPAHAAQVGDTCTVAGHILELRERRNGKGLICALTGHDCTLADSQGPKNTGFTCNKDVFPALNPRESLCVPKDGGTEGVTKSCLTQLQSQIASFNEALPLVSRGSRRTYLVPATSESGSVYTAWKQRVTQYITSCNEDIQRHTDRLGFTPSAQSCSEARQGGGGNGYYKSQGCNCFDGNQILTEIEKLERALTESEAPSEQAETEPGPLACIIKGFENAGVTNVSQSYLNLLAASVQTYGSQQRSSRRSPFITDDPTVQAGAFPFNNDNPTEGATIRPYFCPGTREAKRQTPKNAFLRSLIENIDSKGWCTENTWPSVEMSASDQEWLDEVIQGHRKVSKKLYDSDFGTNGVRRIKEIFGVNIASISYANAFSGGSRARRNTTPAMRNWNLMSQSQRRQLWNGFLTRSRVKRAAEKGPARRCLKQAQKTQNRTSKGGQRGLSESICLSMAQSCGQPTSICTKKYPDIDPTSPNGPRRCSGRLYGETPGGSGPTSGSQTAPLKPQMEDLINK